MVFIVCQRCLQTCQRLAVRTMSSFSVYVTRPDVPKIAFEIFEKKGYKVSSWTEERPVTRDALLKEIVGKDALFCMLTDKIDKEVLDKAGSSLKVIGTMSVGYEHLDVEEISKRKIKVGYTPGVLTGAVAELTLGILLATSRRLFESHQAILDGKWPAWSPTWMCGTSLNNSTVGIVGFGRIGQEIAKLLQPFGIAGIYYTARSPKPEAEKLNAKLTDLDTLVRNSDFVIVACSLTPETQGMFNKSVFSKMKPTSIFVNISRGAIVEQDDLIEALKTGQIAAAGLDVMTPEPIPKDHALLKLPNCGPKKILHGRLLPNVRYSYGKLASADCRAKQTRGVADKEDTSHTKGRTGFPGCCCLCLPRKRRPPSPAPASTSNAAMVQMFYYENRGKCCKKLLKYNGYPNKVLLFPEEGWARSASSSYWTLTPFWWSKSRCKVVEVAGTRRYSTKAKMIDSGTGTLYIIGSFKRMSVDPDFKLYLTSNVSTADFNMGYSMTGTLERGNKSSNTFQMTHFAVIRRRDYDK